MGNSIYPTGIKKKIIPVILSILCILLSGCWDYQSITDLNIVSGIAVDIVDEDYLLTFEIVNVSNGPESVARSVYADATGSTLFEAVRNAKRKLANKFYLGNMQLIVISEKIVRTKGIASILDALLRDGEPRETLNIVISKEETAQAILTEEGLDVTNVSYELNNIIENDSSITIATKNVHLFEAYNALTEPGFTLVLPAVQLVEREKGNQSDREGNQGDDSQTDDSKDQKIIELGGIAIMPDDSLIGYITANETNYFLAVTDNIIGGAFSFSLNPDEPNDIAMEIKKNHTKSKFSYQNNKLKIQIEIKNSMNLIELKMPLPILEKNVRKQLEERCADEFKSRVEGLIEKAQNEYRTDIFSFGNMIYKDNPKLWAELESDWHNIFCNAEIEVIVETELINTGIILGRVR